MHQKLESTNQLEPDASNMKQYIIGSQAWWHGIGHDATSPDVLGESTSNLSSPKQPNGGLGTKATELQANGGQDRGDDTNKEMRTTILPKSDGNCVQEQHHAASVMPPTMSGYLTTPSQLELVGHSIASTSNPNSDPYYGGIMPAYAPQALVHSHLFGVHHSRMALPLEMTEEPVYVNAKQYHGILRRRQSRAKAELEKKLIKVRKPYLHESRHMHAMKRARGSGGRFLKTKKLGSAAININPDRGTGSRVTVSTNPSSSLGSESVPFNSSGNANSSTDHDEVKEPSVQDMQRAHKISNFNVNVSSCYPNHQGFQLSTFYSLTDKRVDEGDFPEQQHQHDRSVVNGTSRRALTIK